MTVTETGTSEYLYTLDSDADSGTWVAEITIIDGSGSLVKPAVHYTSFKVKT